MFEDFLKVYIKDLINEDISEYKITEEEIAEIASEINESEEIWYIIDKLIFDYIEPYKCLETNKNDEEII